jgi:hypothetical protein
MTDLCSICVETFNNVGRKKVVCGKCSMEICTKCIKKFLAENVQEPNCMNCKEVYSKDFMDTYFGYTYRQSILKGVRLNVLVAREKLIMPDLMHRADAYKQCRLHEVERAKLRKKMNSLEISLEEIYATRAKLDDMLKNNIENITTVDNQLSDEFMKSITDAIINTNKVKLDIENQLDQLEIVYNDNWKEISRLSDIYYNGATQKTDSVMNCFKEECKGFLDKDYVCGLCHMKACKDCQEELFTDQEQEHVCKQENIDSVKAIRDETKPCPTCKTRVFKIEGCDQMFCVKCHTGFSWNTGIIERGRIHNPHYFEWLRSKRQQMPREMGDVPCGGLPCWFSIKHHLEHLNIHVTVITYLNAVYKMTEYLQNKEIPKYPITEGRDDELNMIGIKYMADILPENQWKNKLFQMEKKKEINTERRLVLDMMIAVLIDLFGDICNINDESSIYQKTNEFDEIRKYFNSSVKNIGNRFDLLNFKVISSTWMSWHY